MRPIKYGSLETTEVGIIQMGSNGRNEPLARQMSAEIRPNDKAARISKEVFEGGSRVRLSHFLETPHQQNDNELARSLTLHERYV